MDCCSGMIEVNILFLNNWGKHLLFVRLLIERHEIIDNFKVFEITIKYRQFIILNHYEYVFFLDDYKLS